MRHRGLPLKLRLHPAAALFLIPSIIDWASASMRMHSPLGHQQSALVSIGVISVLSATAIWFVLRRTRSGRSRR
jgi:hypothetical protein